MVHPQNKHDRVRKGHLKGHKRNIILKGALKQEHHLRDTTKPCSCPMCGNPRKFFGEKTIQERKHENLND